MASNEWENVHYGVDLMKWLKRKRDDTVPVGGDAARFVFRELVQNADDAQASTMVVRIADDALYVSNDGAEFEHPEEFERLARILGEHKSLDADKAGNFGSGFQTVFYITNAPEIHSAGHAMRLDPGELYDRHNVSTPADVIPSPYGQDGAVFRLPWRTAKDRKAVSHRGQRPFDEEGWPVWGPAQRDDLYSDLEEYSHHLLITCQHLQRIRLLRADGSGMQIERDFTCPRQAAPLPPRVVTMTHARGTGDETDWNERSSDGFPYLLCHSHATDEGNVVVAAYDQDEERRVVLPRAEAKKPRYTVLKHPDIWILMPLFPAAHITAAEEGRWLHSVVPLTVTTKNDFVVSAHLFPEESRRDINVRGEAGDWCRIIRDTCMRLVGERWRDFVEAVIATEQDEEDKQQALLDALPARDPADWIKRLEDEEPIEDDAQPPVGAVDRDVYPSVLKSRIVSSLDEWHRADQATRAHDEAEKVVLDRLRVPRLSEAFLQHPHFGRLERFLEAVDADKAKNAFLRRWREVSSSASTVKLGDKLDDIQVDEEFVHGLITYIANFTQPPQDLPIAPDRKGVLRPLSVLRRPPSAELYESLPLELAVHPDFTSAKLNEVLHACDVSDVLRGLDAAAGRLDGPTRVGLAHAVFAHVDKEMVDFVRKLNGRTHLRIFPTADGQLASLDTVRAAPLDSVTSFTERFEAAGIQVTWIDAAFQKKFAGRLRNWGVKHPDYARLAKSTDWTKRPGEEAADLIGAFLETDEWLRLSEDATVLPLRGRLCPVRDVMLASTGDVRLDAWFNTIPSEVQDRLEATGKWATLTRRIKASAAKTGDVVERLQERCAWTPERFEQLSVEDWEMVTRLLKYIVEKGWERPLGAAVKVYRILPARHRGRLTLVGLAPPRPEQRNRPENAHREDPWLPAFREPLQLPAPLMDRLKMVALHADVQLDPKDLRNRWALFDLNETYVVWHLIANYQGGPDGKSIEPSIMQDDALAAFVGPLPPKEVTAIKKALLKVARSYFDAPKTGKHIKPEDMAQVPLFYDNQGHWRPAQQIAPDRHVRVKGYYPIHPDFDDWPPATLEALGLKKQMDADDFAASLQEAEYEEDRQALASSLALLLTENYDLAKLAPRVAEREWVPTRDGSLRKPRDSLIPTHNLIQVLGEDHPAFYDLRELKDEKRRAALLALLKEPDAATIVSRANPLGIRTDHTLADLLDAMRRMKREDERPPSQLTELLSRTKFPENMVVNDVGYWDGAKWWDARRVFLRAVPQLPPPLDGDVKLVKAPQQEAFLRRIGARDAPEAQDLIEWISDQRVTDVATLLPLWETLVKRRSEITTVMRERYATASVAVPPRGTRLVPTRCLVDRDVDTSDIEGRVILPFAPNSPEGETMRAVGAQTLEAVPTPTLLAIHQRMAPEVTPERTFRRVLTILAGRPDTSAADVRLVCDLGERRVLRPLTGAILPEGDAAAFFRDEVAFVTRAFTPWTAEFLRWARDHGVRQLRDELKEEPPADLGEAQPDSEADERLRAIVAPLQRRMKEEGQDGSPFAWLATCAVRRLPRIRMVLRVGQVRRTVDRACYLDDTRPPVLYLPYRGPAHHYKDIIAVIIEATTARGLRADGPLMAELERDLLYLLQFTRWSRNRDIVDDKMPEFREAIVIIDNTPGLQNYNDLSNQFRRWYTGCQICGTRTPDGNGDDDSRETHTQVAGERGYRTRLRRADVGNYLYLCPTHQVLYKRGLVTLTKLESASLAEVTTTIHRLEQSLRSGEIGKDRVMKFLDECDAHDVRVITNIVGYDELGFPIIEQEDTEDRLTSMVFSIEHYVKYVNHVRDILQEREA